MGIQQVPTWSFNKYVNIKTVNLNPYQHEAFGYLIVTITYNNNNNNLVMKITGKIIFKTTFRCPHNTIIRSKYNIQQITRILMFKLKFLGPRG